MKIVFLDEYSISKCDLTELKSLGEYTGYEITTTAEQVVERCQDADIIISNKVVIDDQIMLQLPNLKLICVAATGMNNIDLTAAAKRGVKVRNAVGYSTHSVAESTIASALALLRQIPYFDSYVKRGDYAKSERLFVFDRPIYQLYRKHWGIIGMGNIGREVARLASAFGCEVAYHSTSGVSRKEDYNSMSLEDLLAWSDVVSIHAPLSDSTRGLIASAELNKMKESAILINVARGGIVCEASLAEVLNNNIIAGAALDVYVNEPLESQSPLTTLNDPSKVILSTHNAWAAEESIEGLVAVICQNIRELA
ncbi:MAG: NAD(P)-dependent oxidoreductase [Rikenellaceae bacterium]